MTSDLARRWIVANALALGVFAITSLLGYAVRIPLAVETEGATLTAKAIYVAVEIILNLGSATAFALLTGKVIRSLVPDLPWERWVALHRLVGLIAGLATGMLMAQPPDPEPIDWRDRDLTVLVAWFVLGAGLLAGFVFGGLQAWVMRRAARGGAVWVAASMAAAVVVLGIAVASFPLLPPEQTFAHELTQQAVFTIAGLVGAVVMLPALMRLRPR